MMQRLVVSPDTAPELDQGEAGLRDFDLWYVGDPEPLGPRAIAVVGARAVSSEGAIGAHRIAGDLARHGVAIVSGLAEGVDTHALRGAIEVGGKVIGVLGTPLDIATPESNAALQEEIYRKHLLISQFAIGARVRPWHFPARNRTMAALSAATVIVEAGEASGTRYQAEACVRLSRWVFVLKPPVGKPLPEWQLRLLNCYDRIAEVETVDEILHRLSF